MTWCAIVRTICRWRNCAACREEDVRKSGVGARAGPSTWKHDFKRVILEEFWTGPSDLVGPSFSAGLRCNAVVVGFGGGAATNGEGRSTVTVPLNVLMLPAASVAMTTRALAPAANAASV